VTGFSAKLGARSGIKKPLLRRNAGSSSWSADANFNYCLYFLSGHQNSRQFSSFLCIKVNTLTCTSLNLAASKATRYGLDGTVSNSDWGARDFSAVILTGCDAHPSSPGLFPVGKAAGA
jgi:hypothetical protein